MVTKEQAEKLRHGEILHYTGHHACTRVVGPRGGVKEDITRVRVSGMCKTWKRNPERFYIPVKYGLYENGYIDERNKAEWHTEEECPLNKE